MYLPQVGKFTIQKEITMSASVSFYKAVYNAGQAIGVPAAGYIKKAFDFVAGNKRLEERGIKRTVDQRLFMVFSTVCFALGGAGVMSALLIAHAISDTPGTAAVFWASIFASSLASAQGTSMYRAGQYETQKEAEAQKAGEPKPAEPLAPNVP